MRPDERKCFRWRVGWSLVLMLLVQESVGHVRLTYPPARKYQFDFLDNARTKGPCGMPPGLDGTRTDLQTGAVLDISWHLSYPHQGGYYFEILDAQENRIVRYPAQEGGFLGSQDGTSIHHSMPLPSAPCENCTLRMLREAREWGGAYRFWSCADINIKTDISDSAACSGHGTMQNGKCVCDRLYKGDHCQFKDECEMDTDCGEHGTCVDIEATSYPKHQCYCRMGWFGSQCQHQSSVSEKPSNMNVYASRTLSTESDVTLYYRLLGDEVEMVLKAKSTSWVAVGWRPSGTSRSCQNFPDLGDGYEMEGGAGESEGEPESEGKPETGTGGYNGTAGEPKSETKPEVEGTTPEPESHKPEPGAEPEGTTPEPESHKPEPGAEPEGTTPEPESHNPEPGAEPEGTTPEPESHNPEPGAEPEGTTPEPESHKPEPGAEPEGTTPEPESHKPEPGAEPEGTTPEPESHKPEPGAEPEGTTPEPESHKPEPGAEPEGTTPEPDSHKPEPGAEPEGTTPEPESHKPEPGAEPEGTTPEPESHKPEPGAEPEGTTPEPEDHVPEPESHKPEPGAEPEGEPEAESSAGVHPMDCTDIIIGSARGPHSRIGDYYTRDRSTPVHDSVLGGENSLTAGLVWEHEGYTMMLFKRKLESNDVADHSIRNELTHVIWAIGQEKNDDGRYNHKPNSALETNSAAISDFYKEDELKYHGHQGQRGASTINFHTGVVNNNNDDDDDCMKGSCPASVCGLDFSWTYRADSDLITFNISSSPVSQHQWIALGFSDDLSMADSDVIYGGIGRDGSPFVTDGWMFGKVSPRVDTQQDAALLSGSHADSKTTLVFTRKRTTNDADDLDLSVCRYIFYANNGGIISSNGISFHSSIPVTSSKRVCFGVCTSTESPAPDQTSRPTTSSTDASTKPTTAAQESPAPDQTSRPTTNSTDASTKPTTAAQVAYVTPVTIRLAQGEFREQLADRNSPEFKQLAGVMETSLYDLLKVELGPSLVRVIVTAFRKGSIVVDFEVETVKDATVPVTQVGEEVKTAVTTSLQSKAVQTYGNITVQQVSSTLKATDKEEEEKEELLTEVEIIIISVVAALLFVALLVALCKCLEMKRTKNKHRHVFTNGGNSSASNGSGSSNGVAKNTMNFVEFMALNESEQKKVAPSGYINSGYEPASFKHVP